MRMLIMAMQVKGVPQVDTGQDGKNVGLNACNEEDFQSIDGNRNRHGQPADQQSTADREAGQNREHHVACRHVRKEPNSQ